jgi:hypothetical protein
MQAPTEEQLSADTQAMLDYRRTLDDLRISQHTAYDRSLITLATAALGASFVILQWIVEASPPSCVWSLVTAWLLLLVAIASTLASFQTSAEDVRLEIKMLDEDIVGARSLSTHRNLWRSLTIFLNRLSISSFTMGTSSLFVFAYSNIPRG